MNLLSISGARALPALVDGTPRPPEIRPASRARVPGLFLPILVLLALLLVAGALTLLPVGQRTAPAPIADTASLPTPAGFSPAPADATRVTLTDPAQRAWTTVEDPDAALRDLIAALTGAGWTVEDGPAGGWLPQMPHTTRLGRRGAQLYLNAWRDPADSLTRVVAVPQR